MLDKSTIQQLRDLPIEGVAERLGLRVTRHKSLCPFHDDHHASMTYSTSRNIYRCFACGAHGGTIDLVMRHLRKDFPDACRWLADTTNIIVEEYNPKTQNSKFDNSTSAQPTIQNSKLKIQNSRPLSHRSFQRHAEELLCLDGKLHGQLVEHLLGVAVHDQAHGLLCGYATLVTVEELVFADL